MPKGSAALRARQSAALAGVLFEKQTDAELGKLIASLQSQLARAARTRPAQPHAQRDGGLFLPCLRDTPGIAEPLATFLFPPPFFTMLDG